MLNGLQCSGCSTSNFVFDSIQHFTELTSKSNSVNSGGINFGGVWGVTPPIIEILHLVGQKPH